MPAPEFPAALDTSLLLSDWQGAALWRVLVWPVPHPTDPTPAWSAVLQLWHTWQQCPPSQRPERLHLTVMLSAAEAALSPPPAQSLPAELASLAHQLRPQWWGLLPGVHRLPLANDMLQLTLWVGDAAHLLRQQTQVSDSVLLGAWPAMQDSQDLYLLKALVRQCRVGTGLSGPAQPHNDALHQAWRQCGITPVDAAESPPDCWHARFAPRWTPRPRSCAGPAPVQRPGHALVVGAGIAGSAVAYSLALRGWQVTVLAAGPQVADGASGLPAGLFCPHVSPDDSVLSRLSRQGVRLTAQRLQAVCAPDQDWAPTGVLEHSTDGGTGLPAHWHGGPGDAWSHPASATQLTAAGLPTDTGACWHVPAGWVRPVRWVQAQLQHPHIHVRTDARVAQLQPSAVGWQACDAQDHCLAEADIAVLATGAGTGALLHALQPDAPSWTLQPIRGQITWGWEDMAPIGALPPFSLNGHGNLVTGVPLDMPGATPGRRGWVMGSTFERDVTTLPIGAADQAMAHAVNFDKLQTLLPACAAALAPAFAPPQVPPTWGAIRIASHDRLPIVGPVLDAQGHARPGLWISTAMGSRGLTLSVLCAELLAARLHGEPLPLEAALAQHLASERLPRHPPLTLQSNS